MSHAQGLRRLGGMRIAITGGTGTLGSLVAAEVAGRGNDVRVLSRSAPEYRVDLMTGEGLARALEGCDVVVDASNNSSRHAAEILVAGSRRLLTGNGGSGHGGPPSELVCALLLLTLALATDKTSPSSTQSARPKEGAPERTLGHGPAGLSGLRSIVRAGEGRHHALG